MIIVRENTIYTKAFLEDISSYAFDDTVFSCINKVLNDDFDNSDLYYSKYNIVKTFDNKETIIYNTLFNSVVILSKTETLQYLNLDKRDAEVDFYQLLLKLGVLQFDTNFETAFLRCYRSYLIKNKNVVPSVTILPTQACNARCRYCFADHNAKITMSQEAIENVISFFKNNFKEGDKVLIRWFGGEPLVAENIIDEIVSKLNLTFNDSLSFESLMFTNSSLLSNETAKRAKDIWRMKKIQLTLDGYKEEHCERKNYSNREIDYYSKVINDIDILLKNDIAVDCRINLDKDNFKQLDNILSDLSTYNKNPLFRVRVTILRPSDCGSNNFNYIYPEDLEWAYRNIFEKLIEYDFITDILSILPHLTTELCLAKSFDKVIIGSDGKLYNCLQQVFNDKYCIGTAKYGLDKEFYEHSIYDYTIRNDCKDCVFYPICFSGCDFYRNLKNKFNVTPCVREKYFIDMILEMVYNVYTYKEEIIV